MKIFLYVLLILCGVSLIGNAFMLDFNQLTKGDSLIALISIIAALCAMLLILIYLKARQLKDKINENDL
jgi:hypothetical protein